MPTPRTIPDQAFNDLFAKLTYNRDRALITFYISTGARASELLGVPQGLVSPGDQTIGVVRKGSQVLQHLRASADAFDRLQEAQDQGWLGEAAIETTMAAAAQKLEAMRERAAQPSTVHPGMPDFRRNAGRSSAEPETPPTAAGPL